MGVQGVRVRGGEGPEGGEGGDDVGRGYYCCEAVAGGFVSLSWGISGIGDQGDRGRGYWKRENRGKG